MSGNKPDKRTNAEKGKDCTDFIDDTDGRVTFEDPNTHGGDWGRHPRDEYFEDLDSAISQRSRRESLE